MPLPPDPTYGPRASFGETGAGGPLPPESVLLGAWKGLKNSVGAERLGPDELQVAQNIDLDDLGQVRRRRGYTRVASGDWHSLFRAARGLYGVKDGDLVKVNPDYSTLVLQSGVGPDPLAWEEVGERLYFTSRSASGQVTAADVVVDWGRVGGDGQWLSPVVNPTATLAPVKGRLLRKPPLATQLAYYNGRLWLGQDTLLWATELYNYDLVDATKGFLPFESPITMILAVTDGLYVGTATDVWFLQGTLSEGMKRLHLLSQGVVPGSAVSLPNELVSPKDDRSKNAIVFLTSNGGLYAGQDAGAVYNLTEARFQFPNAQRAAALFRRQDGVNQYIAVADSGGTPASNARIGDYVDAEIRRFSGA